MKIYIILFFLVFSSEILLAQKGPVIVNGRVDTTAYVARHKELGLKKPLHHYIGNKINLSRIDELKPLGVDIVALDKRYGTSFSYQEETILAPVVIRGVVIKKRLITDTAAVFHTEYDLVKQKLYKGENLSDTFTVKLRSGLVGDYILDVVDEHRLQIGENVLLFLNKVGPGDYMIKNKFLIKNDYLLTADRKKVTPFARAETVVNQIIKLNRN
jgi:hypothetical protein